MTALASAGAGGAGGRPEPASEARRRRIIAAALGVFARYGYRKTAMEEVAHAAQISRQALYLHFRTKEALFRAAVETALAESLQAALTALREAALPLEARLVKAYDEWVGRYVGLGTTVSAASDLVEAAHAVLGPLASEHERRFGEAVARAVSASSLPAVYRAAGLTGRQLADVLSAAARGFKHGGPSREAFVRNMTVAVRALCLPLGQETPGGR
jgi:AcrR family transcriptional regulator